ncbi:MAG: phosphatase PAP2 family protein [Flavobacterium sp.]|jgi:membrane-associated phospholipid phosphatase|nr:phosphatase PAP2 family protein [Flavobacterium sp.]
MKSKIIIAFTLLLTLKGNAQQKDSIPFLIKEDKLSFKQFVFPAVLISGGLLMKNTPMNTNLQNEFRKILGEDFHNKVDNYIQYEALLQIYGGRYLGLKPKNDALRQTINIVVSNAIMGGIVTSMKFSFKELRPDGTDELSFPSGHTATAFTNASILFYEYKDANIWYASSGYLFAAATGFLRIANNKHYTSDVLAGAGIGTAVGLAVSYWSPFKSLTLGKNKTHALIYPQIGYNYGIGLLLKN